MYKERTKRVFEHTTVKNVFTMKTVKSQFKHNLFVNNINFLSSFKVYCKNCDFQLTSKKTHQEFI